MSTMNLPSEGLTHQGGEDPMEVERREIGHPGQSDQRELGVDVLFYEIDNPVDPAHVLLTQQLL
jgi:hypothetical protein